MSPTPTATLQQETHRPVGFIHPEDVKGQRAERAILERRLDDAARNIRAMPDQSLLDRYWQSMLASAERLARNNPTEADTLAWQALGFASAMRALGSDNFDNEKNTQRLIARALHHLGTINRRRERLADALELHQATLRLRARYGSIEEQWESTLECGIDEELSGDIDGAATRIQGAIALVGDATQEPHIKQAIAWDHLCRIQQKADRHGEAVEAARQARDLWHRHDPTAAAVAQADLRLGSALITAEVARRQSEGSCHSEALQEAESLLAAAQESLTAFGPDYAAEARWAREQRDFVHRLRNDVA